MDIVSYLILRGSGGGGGGSASFEITWDGSTEGLVTGAAYYVFGPGSEALQATLYKVSDKALTLDNLTDAEMTLSDGTTVTVQGIRELDGKGYASNTVLLVTASSALNYKPAGNPPFRYEVPEAGTYFGVAEGAAYITALSKGEMTVVEPLTATSNKTYRAENGKAFNPVTVNVQAETADLYAGDTEPVGAQDGDLWVDYSGDVGPQGVPIEVSTSAGMAAVLTSENVGKAYKFTGDTDETYTHGDIYVVEVGA